VPEAKLIFVLPPSVDIMMARLLGRGSERPGDVARRLRSALEELQAVPDFDYVVVNDDLEQCVETIRGIVEGAADARAEPEKDVEAYRAEIARILDAEYADT
jgi:guanylate kinase